MMFKYMCLVLFITWYQLAECYPARSDVSELDAMIDKESEAYLTVEAEESNHKNVRDKRTIGFLRQIFPNLSQIVDRKIQQITRFLFRVIGRLVLRGGNGGGAAGGAAAGGGGESGSGGSRRISITLPTYPPSADDEEEEEETEVPSVTQQSAAAESVDTRLGLADAASPSVSVAVSSTPAADVAASDSTAAASADSAATPVDSVPAASADSTETVVNPVPAASAADVVVVSTTAAAAATAAATTAAAAEAITAAATTTTTSTTTAPVTTSNAPTTEMPSVSDNTVGTGIVKRTAREVSTEESTSTKKRSPLTDTDENDVSSSDSNALSNTAGDDTDDTASETKAEDPRNKRFLFNLRGGGGGGSGNFLFDLIRRGADRAARAAGGFYRVVAGTDPNTLTLAQPLQYPSLIAGSGANQDRDESSNAVPEDTEAAAQDVQDVHSEVNAKEDGYSVGVPGPLTRIFVIANRGVANVIQDLILRLAQTTERIVNFKARLITSLI